MRGRRGQLGGGVGRLLGAVGAQPAVAELQHAAGEARHVGLVRDQHDRDAGAVQLLEQRHDLEAGAAVERAGRLVGEDQDRLVDQRPRDRDALLLAARQLRRAMVQPVAEADRRQRRARLARRVARAGAGIDHRQLDIGERGRARQQVEALEDEADLAVAQRRQPVVLGCATSSPSSR